MKKQTKGIFFTIIFGGGLLFWATAATLPGINPEDPTEQVTITGTPMDNYPDVQREQFCESNENAKSNQYVKEYKIPTPCTQPLAIITDPQGNVWFAQTNTGNLAMFDPTTETFTEYENERWPENERSMMWGMDYSPDGKLWFTDERLDSLWSFSTIDQTYSRTPYPAETDSLPQRLLLDGSKIIVNDFTGNKLTLFDPAASLEGLAYLSVPSPVEGSFTGGFGVDSQDNIWYTNWLLQQGGVLIKLDKEKLIEQSLSLQGNDTALFDYVDIYQFPSGMTTPNGISADENDQIWIADTSSSFFFKFDPNTESFTKYITSKPHISAYGNSSGLIKTPVTRPYWTEFDDDGRLVFNEQTGNRIGVFDPKSESLIEYSVPSKNPNWADCEGVSECGLAQVFDITTMGDKIWFSEWVENNIAVIDTSKPLPFEINLETKRVSINKGGQVTLDLEIIPQSSNEITGIALNTATTSMFSDLIVSHNAPLPITLQPDSPQTVTFSILAGDDALPDIHKVLLGAATDDVVISKYVTVIIEQ